VMVIVHAPHRVRLDRAMLRDRAEKPDIEAKMAAQWTDAERLAQSAYFILNDGSASLIQQVWTLHQTLNNNFYRKV